MKVIGKRHHLDGSFDKYECGCVFFVESNPNVHCPICGSDDLTINYRLLYSNEDEEEN